MSRGMLLVGVLALAACAPAAQAPPPQPRERPSAGVQVQRAERAAGRAWLDAPATVLAVPGASAAVSVPLAARVLSVRVRRGQRVEAGEALIDLVMPDLIRAAGALSGASIRLAAYEKRRQSVAALLERGLARASELTELDVQIADARADRESARATLRAAGVRDAEAPALLGGAGSSALRAPIAGVVVLLSAQLGEVREPASGPLVELADQADVQIEARLAHLPPEHARFSFLGAGERVQLVLEALSPRVSARDGTSLAWFHVARGETAPAPGSTGVVRIDPPEGAVAIPLRALEEGPEGSFVTVAADGSQRKTAVRVLVRGSAEALVSGIGEGVEVLVAQAERGW